MELVFRNTTELIGYAAYTSTSISETGYPVQGEFVAHIIIPESTTAHDVDGLGNNFEREATYPRKSMFIVEKVVYNRNGHPVIYLKEVRNDGIQ